MFAGGRIDISIQKASYAPGDTISGNVDLTFKKPLKAREMTISLIGEYRTTRTTRQARAPGVPNVISASWKFGRVDRRMFISDAITGSAPKYDLKTDTKTVRICGFEQQLDGESEYSESRDYRFKIKLPADLPTSSVVKWYLLAKLDIPHGPDVTKKVGITIG
jgi:hypothetical protein